MVLLCPVLHCRINKNTKKVYRQPFETYPTTFDADQRTLSYHIETIIASVNALAIENWLLTISGDLCVGWRSERWAISVGTSHLFVPVATLLTGELNALTIDAYDSAFSPRSGRLTRACD